MSNAVLFEQALVVGQLIEIGIDAVLFARGRRPDHVAVALEDVNAVARVAFVAGAGDVCADQIALDDIGVRPDPINKDTVVVQ